MAAAAFRLLLVPMNGFGLPLRWGRRTRRAPAPTPPVAPWMLTRQRNGWSDASVAYPAELGLELVDGWERLRRLVPDDADPVSWLAAASGVTTAELAFVVQVRAEVAHPTRVVDVRRLVGALDVARRAEAALTPRA